jgi:hypothetical protein
MPESLMVVTLQELAKVGAAGFLVTVSAWFMGIKLSIALSAIRRF